MATRPFVFQSKFDRGLIVDQEDWSLDQFLEHAESGGVIEVVSFVECLRANDHLDYFLEHPTGHYKESIVKRMCELRDTVRELVTEQRNFDTQAAQFMEKFGVWKGTHEDIKLQIRDNHIAFNPDVIQGQQGLLLWDSVEVRNREHSLLPPKMNLVVFSDASWVLDNEGGDVEFGFNSADLADTLADVLDDRNATETPRE